MTKATTARLARNFKSRSGDEKAFFLMGQICALHHLIELFKKSDHEIAPALVELLELREGIIRKYLRRIK